MFLYLSASFFLVPYVAKYFGREPIIENHRIQAHTLLTKLLNRNYVTSDFQGILQSISTDFQKKHQGIKLIYLDANFPFFDGFPLFPHLSHSDGKKLDISFIYELPNSAVTNKKPTLSGYGFFEGPKKTEFNQTKDCLDRGHLQYDITKYITLGTFGNVIELSSFTKSSSKPYNPNADYKIVENLNSEIGLPQNLGEMGIVEDMIPHLAQHSVVDVCSFTNPVIPTLEDYEKLFVEAIG